MMINSCSPAEVAWTRRFLSGTLPMGKIDYLAKLKFSRYIVASTMMVPERITCVAWGGFVKDIKGRDTEKYQFAVAGNKQLHLWKLEAKTGILEHELINTGSTIREYLCLDFSKNKEDFLYAGTTSGDFCVFQMKNKILASVVNVCALGVTSIVAVDKETLCVGGGNGTLALYHIDGAVMAPIQKTTLVGAVNSLSVSGKGDNVLASTDKGFVYRASPVNLDKALQCENHTESVLFLAYPSKVSEKFASCSEDQTIRLWDVAEYSVEQRIVCPGADSPLCLIYSDEVILSGWGDDKMRMYRIDNGNKVWQIDNAHKGGVTTMCLSGNHKFICSGGAQGECRVWELRSREMVSNLKEHTHRVSKVQLWQDDLHLISASRDKALLCWDLKTEKRVSAHIQRMGGINSFDIVPGENLILTTGQDRKITYWDLREPNAVRSFDTNNNPKNGDECFSLACSHNGKYFATGGSEEIVRLWDIGTGKVLGEGAGHSGTINTVAFSADDKQFISGGKDGSIFLWNVYA